MIYEEIKTNVQGTWAISEGWGVNPSLCYLPLNVSTETNFNNKEMSKNQYVEVFSDVYVVGLGTGQTLVGVFAGKVVYFFS